MRRPVPVPLSPPSKADDEARRRFQIEEIRIRQAELRRAIEERKQRRTEIIAVAKAKLKARRIGVIRRAREKLARLDARFGEAERERSDTRLAVIEVPNVKRTTMDMDEQNRRALQSARKPLQGLTHK